MILHPARLGSLRRRLLSSLYTRPTRLSNQVPIVSFCFDDFPRTSYTAGGAILKSFAARGTYYAAMGLVNTANELGEQFRREDLHGLLADGHELACHTFSHISCRAATFGAFEADVRKGCDAIRELTGSETLNFAYPYGHVTLKAKKKIGGQMRSSRGIYGGLNAERADLNLLRANRLYGDVDQFASVARLLEENTRSRCWLIFYTHDVRANPSQFGCTPALLAATVSLALNSGSRIAPIEDVISFTAGHVLP